MKRRLKRFFSEWSANRAGWRPIDNSTIRRATRDIVGPTGYMVTKSVDALGESGDAYMKSFDDHLPPSLFVSERDRTRLNQAMPLVERAIPDLLADPADKPTPEDYEAAFQRIDAEAVDRLIDADPAPQDGTDDNPDDEPDGGL